MICFIGILQNFASAILSNKNPYKYSWSVTLLFKAKFEKIKQDTFNYMTLVFLHRICKLHKRRTCTEKYLMQGMEGTHITVQVLLWAFNFWHGRRMTVGNSLLWSKYKLHICFVQTPYSVHIHCIVILAACMYYFDHKITGCPVLYRKLNLVVELCNASDLR